MNPRREVVGVLIPFFLIVIAVSTTLATAAALLGRSWWVFELFSHFPVQYLVAQCLALAGFLVLGRHPWALLVLVAAIPNVLAVGPYLPGLLRSPPAGADVPGTAARLVAANVLYTAEDPTPLLDYLDQARPDVVVLSEFTPRWGLRLGALDRTHPHALVLPREGAWGMALYSRHPLRETENVDLGHSGAVNIRAVVDLPQGPVEIWGLHLASPVGRERSALRDAQLRTLARRLAEPAPGGLPRLLAGDLNITAFSPRFRDFLRDSGLRDARRPFGLQVTWPAWPLPVWIAIDQVLAGEGIGIRRVASGPPIGSDHLPVEVDFIPGPAGGTQP